MWTCMPNLSSIMCDIGRLIFLTNSLAYTILVTKCGLAFSLAAPPPEKTVNYIVETYIF
jgi:hypothetical protein